MLRVKTEVPSETFPMTTQTRVESPVGTDGSTTSTVPWTNDSEASASRAAGAAERRRARVRKMCKTVAADDDGAGASGSADSGGADDLAKDEDSEVAMKLLSKKQQRMIRNRESAALSRKRKRDQVEALELEVQQLKEKNRQLKQRLSRYEHLDSMDSARGGSTLPSGPPGPAPHGLGQSVPRGELQPWYNASMHPTTKQRSIRQQVPPPPRPQQEPLPPPLAYEPQCYPPPPRLYVPQSYFPEQEGGLGAGSGPMVPTGLSTTALGAGTSDLPPPPSLIGALASDRGYPNDGTSDDLLHVMPLVDSTSDFYYGDVLSGTLPTVKAPAVMPGVFTHVDSRDWGFGSEQAGSLQGPLQSFGGGAPLSAETTDLNGPNLSLGLGDRQQSWSSSQHDGTSGGSSTTSTCNNPEGSAGSSTGVCAGSITGRVGGGGRGRGGQGNTAASGQRPSTWAYTGGMKVERNNPW